MPRRLRIGFARVIRMSGDRGQYSLSGQANSLTLRPRATLSGDSTASPGVGKTYTVTLSRAADTTYTVTWLQTGSATWSSPTTQITPGNSTTSSTATWPNAVSGSVSFTIEPSVSISGSPINVTVSAPASLFTNQNTGLTYSTLAAAIAAPQTLNGHTIICPTNTVHTSEFNNSTGETVLISKDLTIRSDTPGTHAIFDFSGITFGSGAFIIGDGRSVTLEDIYIRNNRAPGFNFAPGITTRINTGNSVFRRVKVEECNNGIANSNADFTANFVLEDCEIVNCGDDGTNASHHHMYIGQIQSLTMTGCWVHQVRNQDYYTARGIAPGERFPSGHLVKSRAKVTTIRGCRITVEEPGTTNGSGISRCFDFSNGGDVTVEGCLIERTTRESAGGAELLSYCPEGTYNLQNNTYDGRQYKFKFRQNTVVTDSPQVTSEFNKYFARIYYGQEAGSEYVPMPSEVSVVDNVFVGFQSNTPVFLRTQLIEGATDITDTTYYAVNLSANTSGPLSLLKNYSGFGYELVSPVLGSQNWSNVFYTYPTGTTTRTDAYRGAWAKGQSPGWLPAAGKFSNLGQSNTPGTIDPDPDRSEIYSQYNSGGGYNLRFDFWCSGMYVPTLGRYGSFVQVAGGNNAYDGNDAIQLDIAARAWKLMNGRQPYPATSYFDNGYSDGSLNGTEANVAVSTTGAWIGSETAQEPQGQPYIPHTYSGVEFLPPEADGSSMGSFCFFTHSQNSVNIQGVHLWKIDVATGYWSRRTVRNSNSFVAAIGCCYDPYRRGLWFTANKDGGAYQPLGLFFYSWLTNTVTEMTMSGSSGWQSFWADSPNLTYVESKDCILMPMQNGTINTRGDIACLNLSAIPRSSPSGTVTHHKIQTTGTPCPGMWQGDNYGDTAAIARFEYSQRDGCLYVPDAFANLAGSARLYKLKPPAGAVTGVWEWSNETLAGVVGNETLAVRHNLDASYVNGKGIRGNFRYVPSLQSFILYDGRSVSGQFQSTWPDAQLLRPAAFT